MLAVASMIRWLLAVRLVQVCQATFGLSGLTILKDLVRLCPHSVGPRDRKSQQGLAEVRGSCSLARPREPGLAGGGFISDHRGFQ